MYNLLSSKIKSGQVTIKTAADCQNLINMANAAGIATHKIKNLQNAEMKFSRAERLEKERSTRWQRNRICKTDRTNRKI